MVLKSAALASVLQLLVTLGNFILGVLMAYYFGASSDMDAYMVVANVIGLIYSLFMHFQTKALIPHMASLDESEKKESVSAVFRFNNLLFGGFSLCMFLFSPQIVFLLAPGLDTHQHDLASQFMRISSFYLFLSNVVSLGSALMEYHLQPLRSVLISVLRIAAVILFIVLFHSLLGIYSLSWAHIAGSAAVIPLYLLFFRKQGYSGRSSLPLINPHVKSYADLLIPLLIGQILIWGIRLSDSFLASFLPEGSLSYISYSQRIVSNFGMLFTGFYIVYFPLLTRLSRPEDNEEHITLFYGGYQILQFASMAITAFIVIYAPQIVEILFERGAFTAKDTAVVSDLMRFYALMMYCAPMGSYLANAYYGRRLAGKAARISVVSSLVNIAFNFLFVKLWGLMGLAAAGSVSFLVGNYLQTKSLKSVNPLYSSRPMILSLIQSCAAVAAASVPLYYVCRNVFVLIPYSGYTALIQLSIAGSLYAVLLFISALILRYPFALQAVKKITRK